MGRGKSEARHTGRVLGRLSSEPRIKDCWNEKYWTNRCADWQGGAINESNPKGFPCVEPLTGLAGKRIPASLS